MTDWLSVMTFNVRYDNPDDGEHRWTHRREAVADTIRFRNADLLGLQEPLIHQLTFLEEKLPAFDFVGDARTDGGEEGEFSPIGYRPSRFDCLETDTFWLSPNPDEPGSVGWDARYPRIVTWARFRDRQTDTVFVHANTHFSHDGPGARRGSARLLRKRIDEISDGDPIVLTGDFNCVAGDPPYETLTDSDAGDRTLGNARERSRHGHYGPNTSVTDFEYLVPNRKIDHVFVSPGVDVYQHGVCTDLRTDEAYPSDHFPVLADLDLD
jgi:endonuclease/exonuclease/phosphatase family metal-dependent hydrolase